VVLIGKILGTFCWLSIVCLTEYCVFVVDCGIHCEFCLSSSRNGAWCGPWKSHSAVDTVSYTDNYSNQQWQTGQAATEYLLRYIVWAMLFCLCKIPVSVFGGLLLFSVVLWQTFSWFLIPWFSSNAASVLLLQLLYILTCKPTVLGWILKIKLWGRLIRRSCHTAIRQQPESTWNGPLVDH